MSLPRDEIVNLVQFLMLADQLKLPIKKADIIKNALGNNRAAFIFYFDEARNHLLNVFGIKVVEIKDKSSFILVSSIEDIRWRPEIGSPLKGGQRILIAILATIFMSEESLREDHLWEFMDLLQLKPDTKILYNYKEYKLKDLINLWTRQLYLRKEASPNQEEKIDLLKWGIRAENEVNRKDLLNWLCELFGDSPSMWKSQLLSADDHHRRFQVESEI